MRYKIPIDSKEEEKAIGGILTFKQFGFIAGGVAIGVATFAGIYAISGRNAFIALFFAVIPIICSLPFAFLKIHDMSLITYLITKKTFNDKSKILINDKEGN